MVYPRVCGGTRVLVPPLQEKCHFQGLSPRVRGNQACSARLKLGAPPVYPRVCGGTPNWVIPTIPVNVRRLV